jgi:hypothetical protein
MLDFKLYLTEASNEEKLTHLEHAEDHPLNAGAVGYEHAHNTLHGVHQALQGKGSKVSISTKYDGSPSVVFGYHPENKRFFVASKSVFNKEPKLNYTHADIEKNHGHAPGLVSKLKQGLTHLPKVTPHEGVYQGDFMYSKHDQDIKSKGDSYHFKPNTIEYSAKKNSEEGSSIKKAKMGIVVHTAYHGPSLEHMKAEYNTDTSHFNKHDDVHVVSPKFDTKSAHYGPEQQKKFETHIKQAHEAHKKLGDYEHLQGHNETLKTYINSTVKDGSTPHTAGYKSFLQAKANKKIADVKTPAAKQKYQDESNKTLSHVENNKSMFDHTFKLHHHLQQAKNVLNDTLSAAPQKFQHTIDGKLAKPEGHVAVVNNRPTKLVDRAEFSRANFLSARGKNEKV